MERSASVYGSSSALRGVQLKIGEKFKPPAKVTLPVGWKTRDPSQILSLKYDFSLEEQVIERATTEKQAKEQEKNAQRAKELLTSQHSSPVIANMGGDILMPTTVTPGATTEKENKQQFNYKDFEGNSDSPFELVELQSINNMDALKSVLQPQLQNNVPAAASVSVTPSDGVQDAPATYADANILYRPTATDDNQAIIQPTDTFTTTASTTQVTQSSIASPSISSNAPPQFFQSSYPNNPMPGQPIVNQGINTRQDQNLHRLQNSKLYSLPNDNPMPDHMTVGSTNIPSSPQQNNHIPSFNNTNGNVPMPGAQKVLPQPPARPPPRRPHSTGHTHLDASSPAIIDGAAPASVNELRPTPKPRTRFPPIQNHPDSSVVPPPLPPKKLNVKKQGYENVHKPLSKDDNHSKYYPSLPPISPPATLDNPPTITSGSFPPSTLTMSSEELQFVNKLSSMGFPAARAARAVKTFGCKEREVVEFLIAFNGMCDQGYNEEHVELVLKENNSNQEKAEIFLNLLSQFKELGFPEEKIFDALKKSECDSDKTLDILTCAG